MTYHESTIFHLLCGILLTGAISAQEEAKLQSETESDVISLDEMEVSAKREADESYEGRTLGAARTELANLETPQSVAVITEKTLEDIRAFRVSDTFDYVSGVSRQNTFSNLWENFAIRGLSGDSNSAGLSYLLNGFAANRGFNAPRDSANVQSIEFLKGPTATMFGASDPGGTFNVITKSPEWSPRHELTTMAGSYDFFRQEFGSTGPLSDSVAYRIDAAFEDANSFRDFVGSRREFIAPALTWKISDSTTLEFNGENLRAQNDYDRGVPFVNGKLGSIPIDRFYGEPNDAPMESVNISNQVRIRHDLNNDWYVRAAFSHKDNSLYGFASETRNVQANQLEMRRRYRLRDYDSQDYASQVELHGAFDAFGMKNEVLIGFDTFLFENDQILSSGNYATNMNLANPVYGQAKPALAPLWNRTEEQYGLGLLLQDQISLTDQWKLLLGLRGDIYNQELNERVISQVTTQDHTSVTPRVGLTWMATDRISLYGSFSESFRPTLGTDKNFNTFDPEEGRAFEVGAKYESKDGRLGATLAAYDVRKKNVLVTDPTDVNQTFLINGGEVGSRGIEFDISGQITDSFRIQAAATYTDARILASPNPALSQGDALLNVPEFSASILGIQEFDLGKFGQLGIGGGLVHVGSRSAAQSQNFELPSYTSLKALAYLQYNEHVRLFVDVANLTDEEYYASSLNQGVVQPGAPRTFTVGATISF
jgi:iron complex outermembrane receptor protein